MSHEMDPDPSVLQGFLWASRDSPTVTPVLRRVFLSQLRALESAPVR